MCNVYYAFKYIILWSSYACIAIPHSAYLEYENGIWIHSFHPVNVKIVSIVNVGYKENKYLHSSDDVDELSLPRPPWDHYLAKSLGWWRQ